MKKAFIFSVLISVFHFASSLDNYALLIEFALNSQNVGTSNTGIKLLNCIAYLSLINFELLNRRKELPQTISAMKTKLEQTNLSKAESEVISKPKLDLTNKIDKKSSENLTKGKRFPHSTKGQQTRT